MKNCPGTASADRRTDTADPSDSGQAVRPSVCLSVHLSVCPSVRLSVRGTGRQRSRLMDQRTSLVHRRPSCPRTPSRAPERIYLTHSQQSLILSDIIALSICMDVGRGGEPEKAELCFSLRFAAHEFCFPVGNASKPAKSPESAENPQRQQELRVCSSALHNTR